MYSDASPSSLSFYLPAMPVRAIDNIRIADAEVVVICPLTVGGSFECNGEVREDAPSRTPGDAPTAHPDINGTPPVVRAIKEDR